MTHPASGRHAPALSGAVAALCVLAACSGGSSAPAADPGTGGDPPVAAPPVAPAPPVVARWQPAVGDTWQWQLAGPLNTGYAVAIYDIDLVDTPVAAIRALQLGGVRVVCYFSAGSAEDWRPDHGRFDAADMGKGLAGWPGEYWLDTRSATVRAIMRQRLDLAASQGCDGVEPDNVDGYSQDTGFPLNAATQLDYNRFLASEAHARGLAIALKNDIDQLTELAPLFDFAVNEQCHEYGECGGYGAFIRLGKPVLNAEYAIHYRNNTGGARDALCEAAAATGLRTLVLSESLDDSERHACD